MMLKTLAANRSHYFELQWGWGITRQKMIRYKCKQVLPGFRHKNFEKYYNKSKLKKHAPLKSAYNSGKFR